MSNNDEIIMDGGLTDPDDGTRTDVYLVQNGPSRVEGQEGRITADLHFVTGNASMTVVNIQLSQIVALANFLDETARELMRREDWTKLTGRI